MDEEKFSEMDNSNGSTAMQIYLVLLNYTVKMVSYHNKNKKCRAAKVNQCQDRENEMSRSLEGEASSVPGTVD